MGGRIGSVPIPNLFVSMRRTRRYILYVSTRVLLVLVPVPLRASDYQLNLIAIRKGALSKQLLTTLKRLSDELMLSL